MLKPDAYAVMGNPIGHSKSPQIHRTFAQQTGQDMHYDAILVEPNQFADAAERFRAEGGKGLNITLPFKLDAWQYADALSDSARLAGAVNTLMFKNGESVLGDNTDGRGLICDLCLNHRVEVHGRRLLVLGAGGASRGIIGPLLQKGPASLLIANRTAERAHELAALFAEHGSIQGCGLSELRADQTFDLVLNATSASLQQALPPLPDGLFGDQGHAYDLAYGDQPTPFMRWAQSQNAVAVYDGLGMLVEQAAESFALWRGVRPFTQPVIAMLRLAQRDST